VVVPLEILKERPVEKLPLEEAPPTCMVVAHVDPVGTAHGGAAPREGAHGEPGGAAAPGEGAAYGGGALGKPRGQSVEELPLVDEMIQPRVVSPTQLLLLNEVVAPFIMVVPI
jgi:hypothetical protein